MKWSSLSGEGGLQDALYALLPEQGEFVAFEAARVGLRERTGNEISADELAQQIFSLVSQGKVDWLPDDNQLRRASLSRPSKKR